MAMEDDVQRRGFPYIFVGNIEHSGLPFLERPRILGVEAESLEFKDTDVGSLFRLKILNRFVEGYLGDFGSVAGFEKNANSRNEIGGAYERRDLCHKQTASLIRMGLIFVGVILCAFGTVLFSRIFSSVYLNGAVDLDLASYRAFAACLIVVMGGLFIAQFFLQ